MSGVGEAGAAVGGIQMQQVQAYCDNGGAGALMNNAAQFSSMPGEGFFWNLFSIPGAIARTAYAVPGYIFNTACSTFCLPYTVIAGIYRYIYPIETETNRVCRRVLSGDNDELHKVNALGQNALGQAVRDQNNEAAQVYAIAGVSSEVRAYNGFSHLLHSVASNGNVELLQRLLSKKEPADVNAVDLNGMSPLHLSALLGHPEVLMNLLHAKANPNLIDRHGRTCALLAAKSCHECFKILADRGVILTSKDDQLAGAWHYAASNQHSGPIMSILYQKSVPINQPDMNKQTAMHLAAANGNGAAIDNLVYYGFSTKMKDIWGREPLHIAAENGNTEAINRLIAHGADVNALAPNLEKLAIRLSSSVSYEETPLMIAAKHGHSEAVGSLIANYADVNIKNKENETALTLAALNNNVSVMKKLVAAGANINHIPDSGMSALYQAYKKGNEDVALFLANHGGLIQASHNDDTLLNEAVAAGDFKKVQTLILKGALLNARDFNHHTPLMIAAMRGNYKILDSLLAAAVSYKDKGMLNVLDTENRQAIHFAARASDPEILKRLQLKGATHRACDVYGQLPIHYAAIENKIPNLKYLARLNYNPPLGVDVEDKEQQTPLMYAVLGGHIEAAQVLLERGASPALINKEGKSSLHLAAIRGDIEMMQLMLEKGNTGISWTDNDGHTPLAYAEMGKHKELADLLISRGAVITSEEYDDLAFAIFSNDTEKVALLLKSEFPDVGKKMTPYNQTPLHISTRVGNSNISQMLAAQMNKTLINYPDSSGNTPLITAAMHNRTEDLKNILKQNGNIHARNSKGETAIHLAAKNGNCNMIEALALAGANLEEPLPNGLTPLGLAFIQDQKSAVEFLIELGAEPRNFINKANTKTFALLKAISLHEFEKVQNYLLKGANIQVADADGWTALHTAVVPAVPLEILESLIDAGLDVNALDNRGASPIILAAHFKNLEAIKILLKQDSQIQNSPAVEQFMHELISKAAEGEDNGQLIVLIEGFLNK